MMDDYRSGAEVGLRGPLPGSSAYWQRIWRMGGQYGRGGGMGKGWPTPTLDGREAHGEVG